MTGEASATVAMAVEDVPEVSEDLEGDPTAKAPPRCPGCRVHVLAPPCGRLSSCTPGQVIARGGPDRPVVRPARTRWRPGQTRAQAAAVARAGRRLAHLPVTWKPADFLRS